MGRRNGRGGEEEKGEERERRANDEGRDESAETDARATVIEVSRDNVSERNVEE